MARREKKGWEKHLREEWIDIDGEGSFSLSPKRETYPRPLRANKGPSS